MSDWRPHPGPQTEVLMSEAYEKLYGGQRGGGKTDAGIVWLIDPEYINHPRYRALVLRKDAKDLADWIDRAKYMYRSVGGETKGNPLYFVFPSGAMFRTGHLKNTQSVEGYLGQEYQKILIEELTLIPDEELYVKILGSCRSSFKSLQPQILSTTNPGGPGHNWVKKRWKPTELRNIEYIANDTGRSRIFIPAALEDNPSLVENDPGYVKTLESYKYINEKLYRAWRHGDWDVFEGMYFTEWDVSKHVVEPFEIPLFWDRYRSIDWGYSPDPAVCSWYAVSPKGIVYKYREVSVNKHTPEEFAYFVRNQERKNEKINYTMADPSIFADREGNSIGYQLGTYGINAMKADNSRVDGWTQVRAYLKTEKFKVFSDCIHTIDTYPLMQHDEKKPEDMAQGNDHYVDTDRYFLMTLPKPSIKPVVEDFVDSTAKMAYQDVKSLTKNLFAPGKSYKDEDLGEFYY